MVGSAVNISAVRAFAVSLLVQLECCIGAKVFDVFCNEKSHFHGMFSEVESITSPLPSFLYLFDSTELKLRLLLCTLVPGQLG